jgi:hypothetical protein
MTVTTLDGERVTLRWHCTRRGTLHLLCDGELVVQQWCMADRYRFRTVYGRQVDTPRGTWIELQRLAAADERTRRAA